MCIQSALDCPAHRLARYLFWVLNHLEHWYYHCLLSLRTHLLWDPRYTALG